MGAQALRRRRRRKKPVDNQGQGGIIEARDNDGHTAKKGEDGKFTGSEPYKDSKGDSGEGSAGNNTTIKEISKPLTMSDSQFGKKMGKHNDEWGIDPKKPDDREKFKQIIRDIVHNHDKPVKIGEWRGYSEETLFFIKGEDVVITTQEGKFVSILKGGINNGRVKDAREY